MEIRHGFRPHTAIPTESGLQSAAARCLHATDRDAARAAFTAARAKYESAVSLPEPSNMDLNRAREMNPARDW